MSVSADIEQIRALLPDVVAVLTFAHGLEQPVDPVLDAYLHDHVGFWRLDIGLALDVGLKRQRQEDGVFVDPAGRAFVAIDGMGGQGTGVWATEHVMEALAEVFPHPILTGERRDTPETCPLVAAFKNGHDAIEAQAATGRGRGMGTAAAGIFVDGTALNIAHVGDCRVYRLRRDTFEPLTSDHSFINEYNKMGGYEAWAATQPGGAAELSREQLSQLSNIVTRSIGLSGHSGADWSRHPIEAGDTFLICTDGLSGDVPDDQLASILRQTSGETAQVQASALMDAALVAGGNDNIGLVVVRFPGAPHV
jgi:serine/threonine protein phosphatase PrpC